MLIAFIYLLLLHKASCFVRLNTVNNLYNIKKCSSYSTSTSLNVVYNVNEERARDYVKESEMIVMVPTYALNLEQMDTFQRSVLGKLEHEIISGSVMVKALDRTPFVTLVNDVKSSKRSYMYIFIDKENFRTRAKALQENLFKWLRSVSKNDEDLICVVLLARKSHVMRFSLPMKI